MLRCVKMAYGRIMLYLTNKIIHNIQGCVSLLFLSILDSECSEECISYNMMFLLLLLLLFSLL